MDCKLVKEILEIESKQTKGEKIKITNFYLVTPNGEKVRIQANSWKDTNGVHHSNMSILSALATDINKLSF